RDPVAGGETRHRAQPAFGAAVASAHICCAHRFRFRRETRRVVLLVAALDRGSACLRTQNRKTRSRRNQSCVFSKQRVCKRSVSHRCLRRSINLVGRLTSIAYGGLGGPSLPTSPFS